MDIKEVIKQAQESSNPTIESIPKNTFLYTAELLYEIEVAFKKKEDSLLEDLLAIAARDGLNHRYTSILCQMLKEDWHYCQEDIAMMLEEIRDPTSITPLYERAINFLDYDDGRSLSRKCIWALGAIGTSEAKEKLILLKEMDDPIISEVATLELHHKFDKD